jgi:hypothetical protein
MKAILSTVVVGFIVAAGSAAMAAGSDITMSTDPAKIAAVEQHAKELQARGSTPHTAKGAKKASKHAASHKPAPAKK